MSDDRFTSQIDWPNGEGFTPCTPEYRAKLDEQMAICDPNTLFFGMPRIAESVEDLSPEDYNRWHTLQHELDQMHGSGQHIGKSERYDA